MARDCCEQTPRLGRVALGTLDHRQLVQRGGLALQVAESLVDGQGLLEQPPRLGRVALGTLDHGQLVQRGGLALQISRLLIELERLAIELPASSYCPRLLSSRLVERARERAQLILRGTGTAPQGNRPLVPAIAELPEAAAIEDSSRGNRPSPPGPHRGGRAPGGRPRPSP